MTIRPDGKLYVQSGVGNLGTHSVIDLARVAAEVLDMPWEKVEVIWGDTGKHLPWTCPSVGSQTTHGMTRANMRARWTRGGSCRSLRRASWAARRTTTRWAASACTDRGNPGRGLSFAQAARRAIELGGKFDGHELPEDINPMTRASATALAGLGLMGVAKDTYPRDGVTYGFVIGFAEVEVDVETGGVTLVDFVGVGDVGTVINPRSLVAQIKGGACLGIAHALFQKSVVDPQYGVSLGDRFHYSKPLTILDIPATMQAEAVGLPDPGDAGGRQGRRRAAGRRRLRRRDERDCRRRRRRRLPPGAGHGRHHPDVAREWPADARTACAPHRVDGANVRGARMRRGNLHGCDPRRDAGVRAVPAGVHRGRAGGAGSLRRPAPGCWPAASTASTG